MKKFITPVVAFVAMVASMLLNACTEPLTDTAAPDVVQTEADALASIEFSPEELRLVEQIANNSPKISQENAQQTAMLLLGLQDEESENNPAPSFSRPLMSTTVFCNRKTVYNGLSKSYEVENDTAFYIFNTTDDNGFAIVAADLRVPNEVLAFSEHGNFDPESGNPGAAYFIALAQDYVADCIAKAEAEEDSIYQSICSKLGIDLDSFKQDTHLSKTIILDKAKCTVVGTPKITIENLGAVAPMLTTHWTQDYPFNDKCDGCNAGCVPIAIAQMMAYWGYPKTGYDWNLMRNNDIMNSVVYRHNKKIPLSAQEKNYVAQVAKLVRFIGDGCKADYHTPSTSDKGGYGKGTVKNNQIISFLRSVNLTSQRNMMDYSFSSVVDAIRYGRPVLFTGVESKTGNGHAWVADGYLKRIYTKEVVYKYCIVEQYDDGSIGTRFEDIPTVTRYNYNFLSFKWGWLGTDDGYYQTTLYDQNYRMEECPDGSFVVRQSESRSPAERYDKSLKTVMDIRP